MSNRIQLTGEFLTEEGLASGTVKPGHLLEMTNATANTVKAHATEGGYSERAFAVEDALQGDTVDDSYSDGDMVAYHLVEPGAVVLGWLEAGVSYAKGEKLISAGGGNLKKETEATSGVTVKQIIAIVETALDLSGSSDVDTQSPVRVL